MRNNVIPDNNVAKLKESLVMKRIHVLREKLPITHIGYSRIYNDKTMMLLTSNVSFYEERFNINIPLVIPTLKKGFSIVDEYKPIELRILEKKHAITNLCCTVEKFDHYTEFLTIGIDKAGAGGTNLLIQVKTLLEDIKHNAINELINEGRSIDDSSFALPSELIINNTDPYCKHQSNDNDWPVLAKSEQECLSLLIKGHTRDEICKIMKISISSVGTYLSRLMHKFDCNTRSALVRQALYRLSSHDFW